MSSHYPSLAKLSHKARANLVVKFYPSKTLFESLRPRLCDFASPSHVVARDIYRRMRDDRLNWRVITNVSAKHIPQAIVRNKLKKRYISALSLALKERGYHPDGKVRSDASNGAGVDELQTATPRKALRGTLEIYVFHKFANNVSFKKLGKDADMVIDAVCKNQEADVPQPLLEQPLVEDYQADLNPVEMILDREENYGFGLFKRMKLGLLG